MAFMFKQQHVTPEEETKPEVHLQNNTSESWRTQSWPTTPVAPHVDAWFWLGWPSLSTPSHHSIAVLSFVAHRCFEVLLSVHHSGRKHIWGFFCCRTHLLVVFQHDRGLVCCRGVLSSNTASQVGDESWLLCLRHSRHPITHSFRPSIIFGRACKWPFQRSISLCWCLLPGPCLWWLDLLCVLLVFDLLAITSFPHDVSPQVKVAGIPISICFTH